MKNSLTRGFILLDTEYTANEDSKRKNWKGEYREIIQIAAIGVSPALEETWQMCFHVKPIFKPRLSEFIKKLTGITQAQVDAGISLGAALSAIEAIRRDTAYPICCYGEDGNVIEDNCKILNIVNPIPLYAFLNLRPILEPTLRAYGADPRNFSSGQLIRSFGKEGKPAHNALSDVQNLLLALQEMRARKLF